MAKIQIGRKGYKIKGNISKDSEYQAYTSDRKCTYMKPLKSRLVVGEKTFSRFTRSEYCITIETPSPGGGTFANPIERFPDLRVHHCISLSVVSRRRQGEDGALEPSLELFEPLITGTNNYYVPWNIPCGLRLSDSGEWGGWEAWLGNDNDSISNCSLEFLDIKASSMSVRWAGDDFLFEGQINVLPMVMYGMNTLNVQDTLTRIFGANQASSLLVTKKAIKGSQTPGWTKYIMTPEG